LVATVTPISSSKPYDNTPSSNQPVTNITGLLPGDKLTGLTQFYNNTNVLGPNGSTLMVNHTNVGVAPGPYGSLLSDYSLNYSQALGTIAPIPLSVANVIFNRDGTLNTSGAVFTGLIPGDSVGLVPGSTPGTIMLAGPHAGNYLLTDPSAGLPIDDPRWVAAVYAILHTNTVLPPPWLTITQSPESPQMRELADTGELPTTGPRRAQNALPSSSLICVQGAIRVPDGVASLPIDGCSETPRFAGG